MSRLDSAGWCSQEASMSSRGIVNIPESALVAQQQPISPLSPVSSLSLPFSDSLSSRVSSSISIPSPPVKTFVERSAQLSPSHGAAPSFSSSKHLLYGGPGFSMAVVDSSNGSVDRVPIPLPAQEHGLQDSGFVDFTSSEVISVAVVGESQVWAGTESGSLHVFTLGPDLQLMNHKYTNLTDSILCISSRIKCRTLNPVAALPVDMSVKIEVLLGSADGTLTTITGDIDERGNMKDPLKCLRKVVRLGGGVETQRVRTIAHVVYSSRDTYWCGCGSYIVVLTNSDFKELKRFDTKSDGSSSEGKGRKELLEVAQLLPSECGVWSILSQSPAVTLWDPKEFTPKLHISCCESYNSGRWMNTAADIRCLSFCYPLLFVGTNGGHLLVFKMLKGIKRRQSLPISTLSKRTPHTHTGHTSTRHRSLVEYKLVTGTHCGPDSIVAIHPTPLHGGYGRSSLGTPCSTMQVLVTCTKEQLEEDSNVPSSTRLLLYELLSSPSHSPIVSPTTGQVSPDSSSSLTASSHSLQRLRTLPNLVLNDAAPNPILLLPLKSS